MTGIGRTRSISLAGLRGDVVDVEADIAQSLPGFTLLGLPDQALQESRDRIRRLIGEAEGEGARVLVDGRERQVDGFADGSWVFPTVLDDVPVGGATAGTEIFGPVFGLQHVDTIEEAIARINGGQYGNMACLFTSSGAAARQFRYEAEAGNIGINIGVAAPLASFPFSGWKDSFFGDLHAQGAHAVEFYTQTKVVVERWPKVWSRVF